MTPPAASRAHRAHGPAWPDPVRVAITGSTNADVLALARAGAPEGTTVVAVEQTAGRGRLGRSWVSGAGLGLWFSTLLRLEDVDRGAMGRVPLLAGVAVARAIRGAGTAVVLKWPNDILAPGDDDFPPQKVGGILAESDGQGAVVVGIGVNVRHGADDLPVEGATSLALRGSTIEPDALLDATLAALRDVVEDLRSSGAVATMAEYRRLCATIGREVSVSLPAGDLLVGRAVAVAEDGRLVVRTGAKTVYVAAGDVIHATI